MKIQTIDKFYRRLLKTGRGRHTKNHAVGFIIMIMIPSLLFSAIPVGAQYQQGPDAQAISGIPRLDDQLNPELIEYQQQFSPGSADIHGRGYIPPAIDLSYLNGMAVPTSDIVTMGVFPARYMTSVSPVKDQTYFGTCWAFTTYGSLESTLLTAEDTTRDFSEKNLVNLAGFDPIYPSGVENTGGNYIMSTAYLARWGGPIPESDDPYPSGSVWAGSSGSHTIQKHVQNVYFIPGMASASDLTNVKTALMNYGAVYTSINTSYTPDVGALYWNYNPVHCAYYNPSASNVSDHAVTIVGWDDNFLASNFTPAAPGNGAFIIKNSWGTSWGDNGYFYVSYYDAKVGSANAVFLAEPTAKAAHIYQYDKLGLVNWLGYSYNINNTPTETNWFSNVFQANGNEKVTNVSFYARYPGMRYTIYIYTSPSAGNPASGTLQTSQSGTLTWPGYNTITINNPVSVTPGQKFSVIVKETNPTSSYYNCNIPVCYASSYALTSSATGVPNVGYVSNNGVTWDEITSTVGTSTITNCLKAFTVDVAPPATVVFEDNFDDNAINSSVWNIIELRGPQLIENNHQLEMSIPPESTGDFWANLQSKFFLRGDFDVQADYSLLEWPSKSGIRIGIDTKDGAVERNSLGSSENPPIDAYCTQFNSGAVIIVPTSDTTGKLRLVRQGSTISGYYWNGGNWALIASGSSSGDTPITLAAWSGDSIFSDSYVNIAFDNFIVNSGELIYPQPTASGYFYDDLESGNLNNWTLNTANNGGSQVIDVSDGKGISGSKAVEVYQTYDPGWGGDAAISKMVYPVGSAGAGRITVWFYDDVNVVGTQYVFMTQGPDPIWRINDDKGLAIGIEDASYYSYMLWTGFPSYATTSNIPRSTGWHNLTMIADGSQVKGYIDGRLLVTTQHFATFNFITLGTLWWTSGPGIYYDNISVTGLKAVEEVADKDVILTGGESDWMVTQLYYNGLPCRIPNVPVTFSSDNDSVAMLPATRTIATDSTGEARIPLTSGDKAGIVNVTATIDLTDRYSINDSVTISVVDRPIANFNSTSYEVGEDAGLVTINVTRTGFIGRSGSVVYSISGGNATNGKNYQVVYGQLAFQPGEASNTFTIPIIDDGTYAPLKYFEVELSNPVDTTIGTGTTRVNIFNTDNAPVFQFNATSLRVRDNASTIFMNITKTGETEMNARVSYTASNGTGNSSEDYVCSPGSLTFVPGEKSKYIPVTIVADAAYEPDETFNLVLSSPTNATIGANQTVTVTINSTKAKASEVSFTYDLKKGWNLISIPVVPQDGNLTTFFQPIMSNVSIVWEYNSSNGSNAWAYYTTMTDKYKQGTLRTVNERQGYWVRCTNDTVFTVTGYSPKNNNVTLNSGWNLIGNPTMDIRQPLTAYPNEKIVWEYNSSNTSSPWAYHTTMTDKYKQGGLTQMSPGYGYWVRI